MALKVSDIEPLVDKYKGNIAAIARHFGVTRQTIYNKINTSQTLNDAIQDAREGMIDNAESMLYRQIGEGNTTAIIFFLKTQGKGRGYVERQEHQERTWKDDIVQALIDGRLKPEDVKLAYADEPDLVKEFFNRANVRSNAD